MEHFHIRDSREVPDALRQLYESYRTSLPDFKQAFVGKAFPSSLLNHPGMICFQNNAPAVALTWSVSPTIPASVTAQFYFEQTWAGHSAVKLVIMEYLKAMHRSSSHCFELWISPSARIHQVLSEEGFEPMKRELLELTSKAPEGPCPQGVNFSRLNDLHITPRGLQELSDLLLRAYENTVDGAFFERYSTPSLCQEYLSRILDSAYCDVDNSWIAYTDKDSRAVGMAFGYLWPNARAVYLEQLAVHPSFRGRGLGRELFRRFSAIIGTRGTRKIILTVSKDNSIPNALYRSAGTRFLDTEFAYFKKAIGFNSLKSNKLPYPGKQVVESIGLSNKIHT